MMDFKLIVFPGLGTIWLFRSNFQEYLDLLLDWILRQQKQNQQKQNLHQQILHY